MNETLDELRHIASQAGWDEYTLLLQICTHLDEQGQSEALLDKLGSQAADEED